MDNVISLDDHRRKLELKAQIEELAQYLYDTSSILTTKSDARACAEVLFNTGDDDATD